MLCRLQIPASLQEAAEAGDLRPSSWAQPGPALAAKWDGTVRVFQQSDSRALGPESPFLGVQLGPPGGQAFQKGDMDAAGEPGLTAAVVSAPGGLEPGREWSWSRAQGGGSLDPDQRVGCYPPRGPGPSLQVASVRSMVNGERGGGMTGVWPTLSPGS